MPELWPRWGSAPQIALARRKAPWVVLVIGFGGLLACIVGAAVGSVGALDHVRRNENRSLRAYLERQSALDQIRSQIYLSGTYVRDLLLAPDPSGVAAQSSRLAGLERDSKAALETYSRSLDPEEKEPFRTLESEIDDYWQVLRRTAQWTPEERNQRRDSFFYDELAPRRTTMLQIADRIALVNERGLTRAEDQLAASSEGLRHTLMFTFGLALVIGLALAGVTSLYTLRLERKLERGLDENARARGDLQELSAKLERAQENERRTLARELHDEVGQSLSAILMETENAECAGDVDEMRAHLAAVKKLAGKDGQRGARSGVAAAALHVGRFRFGARAQLARPRNEQAYRPERSGFRRRRYRRSSRRAQNLYLPGGAGSGQQFRAPCQRPDRGSGGEARRWPRPLPGTRRRRGLRRPIRARTGLARHGGAGAAVGRRPPPGIAARTRNSDSGRSAAG